MLVVCGPDVRCSLCMLRCRLPCVFFKNGHAALFRNMGCIFRTATVSILQGTCYCNATVVSCCPIPILSTTCFNSRIRITGPICPILPIIWATGSGNLHKIQGRLTSFHSLTAVYARKGCPTYLGKATTPRVAESGAGWCWLFFPLLLKL